MTKRIRWTCDACGEVVRAKKGAVFVRASDIRKARQSARAVAEWRDAHRGGLVITDGVGDPPPRLSRAPWRVIHHACDPTPDDCYYWFDVAEVGDLKGLASWNYHLHEKTWTLALTNWTTTMLARISGFRRSWCAPDLGDLAREAGLETRPRREGRSGFDPSLLVSGETLRREGEERIRTHTQPGGGEVAE